MPRAAGLYYEVHGPSGAPRLILSSGLGGSASYWAPNLEPLARSYGVLAYDHRGTGRSDRDVPGDLTIEAMARDLILLLDAVDWPSATIVGHALGGMIGMALAIAEPARVDQLVAVNCWAGLDPHTARCFDTRLALLRDSGVRAFVHAQPIFLYPAAWISAHHARLMEEEEQQLADFAGAEMTRRRIAAARRFNPGERLRGIAAPTLLMSAEDDMLVPAHCSAALARTISQAQHARMSAGGHACNVTHADHFNMWLIDWLDAAQGE
ncbi:pyrimidine utilization protein D [uncultured Sphingomonas sp.]|uniref:pyrimidine utilization protein D n=1 Tax=uncultured Sphingomonas sp. TaxID=158754 RepID=UPI0035C97BE0